MKPENDLWSIEGHCTYRHHVEQKVKLYVPKEESFQRPLECIDVVRRDEHDIGGVAGKSYGR